MTPVERAAAIDRDLPVGDGHNDLPWAIRTRAGGSLAAADPGSPIHACGSRPTQAGLIQL